VLKRDKGPGRLLGVLRSAFRPRGAPPSETDRPPRSGRARFRMMYERFREILALNDRTLELIAEISDRLSGHEPFSLEILKERVRKTAMDVFVMVKDLNQLSGGRHDGLYEALRRIDAALEPLLGGVEKAPAPLIVSLKELRREDVSLAGNKMANLGDAGRCAGLRVPAGFAITTAATARFLSEAGLRERCERLEGVLELEGAQALGPACAEVQAAVRAAPVGEELSVAIRQAFSATFSPDCLVAVRSSAVGEDSREASHAGLYATELRVSAARLFDAWRGVLASAYGPAAVSYRYERGLPTHAALMAVGCVAMVGARCAGILHTRPPDDPGSDTVVIGATHGVADRLAAGEEGAELIVATPGRENETRGGLLSTPEVAALVSAARRLEEHFGGPQDVEWAIEEGEGLVILQARPLVALARQAVEARPEDDARPALLSGGLTACPGIGSGPVVPVRPDDDLAAFPEGGVLVAHHSSPAYSRVMVRCAAIVTDVGSPIGHMANLAREFDVPAIVGMAGATATLEAGDVVTVDARLRKVFAGPAPPGTMPLRARRPPADTPAGAALREIAAFVTPLKLTDSTAPEFAPEGCRSLHDVTRFIHEKAYEVMFHYGDLAVDDREASRRLDAPLPITVRVFDVGGGIAADASGAESVTPGQITSVPMTAFLSGMLEKRIRWDQPRPVSVSGFLSVLGESISGPPAEARQIGRLSYAIVSDRYMNFSTKAGYHFSTVDTYCGQSQNKNYVHFRFSGGAADPERRERRVRFLRTVLNALDFKVQARGDFLTARLDKYGPETIRARLVDLGHLTLCARQLDMLMGSDASPDSFAQAFLAGEWEKF
jgi:pyruvate,water dikinase